MGNGSQSLQARIAELQQLFYQQLPDRLSSLEHCWQQLQQQASAEALSECHHLCHTLAGTGGTFGAHAISGAARNLEQALKPLLHSTRPIEKDTLITLEHLLKELMEVVNLWSPDKGPEVADGALELGLPLATANNNLVYLVDDDQLLADELSAMLEANDYRVQHFLNTDAFVHACHSAIPCAVIMDMVFSEGADAGSRAIERMKAMCETPPPVIFISVRNDIQARLSAVRNGAWRYFTKPVNHNELLYSLDGLTQRRHREPYRVLIVDDDDTLAQFYSEVLEEAGMETAIINNPMMTLEIIEEFQPELLLLDIYMAECSGLELAAVLRQDDQLTHMPIIFLSDELDARRQMNAMHLGGDDFIGKPVSPELLCETVTSRAKRARRMLRLNRRLEDTLRDNESQRKAIDHHSIVSIADTSGAITYVNDKFCEISGYSREELMGKNHRIVKSDVHPRSLYEDMWHTISNGKIWHGTVQNRRKDGTPYWVESTIVPFLDKRGLPYQYISVRTDVSKLMQVQEQMSEARDLAESASRAKSAFLSSMSHELRTPMNAILGFAQLLEMEGLNDEQSELVKEILKGGSHLLTLINDVLDLSKIESGNIDLSIEPVETGPLFDECNKLIAPLVEQRGLEFLPHCSSCSRFAVKADRTRLKQVLLNLLSNAVKYNRNGGSIQIQCGGCHDDRIRISVTDTGQGIAEERIPELFEPFNRLDAESGTIEGTGIGLSISKTLVEMMGGSIGVDSQPGRGSTFWLEFAAAETLAPSGNEEAESSGATTTLRGEHTVLYIEDNPVNLRLVSMVLSKRPGIRLLTAHEPILGLEMAEREQPELILLDINLPEMDGYEVLKRLFAHERTQSIPVVAVSANALPKDVKRGMRAGFTDYLTKPINVKAFTATVENILGNQDKP